MSLSLRTTSRSVSITPALFSASNAMPADIAPSPIIATARRFSPFSFAASAMPERGRDRGAGVRGAEGVVFALAAPRETRDAVEHAQPAHALAPAGEDLVRVGLVADVPDDAVLGRVEHVVQRDGELHRAEVGRQVAAGLRHRLEHVGAQLFGELPESLAVQAPQVGRIVDRLQQLVHGVLARQRPSAPERSPVHPPVTRDIGGSANARHD